jgi:hypothetical protein
MGGMTSRTHLIGYDGYYNRQVVAVVLHVSFLSLTSALNWKVLDFNRKLKW